MMADVILSLAKQKTLIMAIILAIDKKSAGFPADFFVEIKK